MLKHQGEISQKYKTKLKTKGLAYVISQLFYSHQETVQLECEFNGNFQEIETDGIDCTNGLIDNDFVKLEKSMFPIGDKRYTLLSFVLVLNQKLTHFLLRW